MSRWMAFTPVVLVAGLLGCWLADPAFYSRYVLTSELHREFQVVELVTSVCAFGGGILSLLAAPRLRRTSLGAAVIALAVGGAALLLAGEETRWGRRWFGFALETSGFPYRRLANAFLVVVFFVLPFLRWRRRLPRAWWPAVPEPAVAWTVAFAFLWRAWHHPYLWLRPWEREAPTEFFAGFAQQLGEHKEMLVAVSLLFYGLLRGPAARRAEAEKAR